MDCEVRALTSGSIFQQVIVADDTALVSPYLYTANTHHTPCLEVSRTHPIFETFTHKFEVLWNANAPTDS